MKDNKLSLFGKREEKRDYLFIQNLIGIIKHLAFNEARGILNLVSGNSFSSKEIASLLRKITKQDFSEITLDRKNRMINQGFIIDKLVGDCRDVSFADLEKGLQRAWGFANQ
jgi:nucleoside-diphosphate-sugar epimerase